MFSLVKKYSAVLLTFFIVAGAQAGDKEVPPTIAGTTKVTAEGLIDLVQTKMDLVIIDSRKPSDRANGYIEGSIGLVNTETNADSLAQHLPGKSTPVLFYCNGIKCGRSAEAAEIAVEAGYSDIYWFRGGWDEWTSKGYPIVK